MSSMPQPSVHPQSPDAASPVLDRLIGESPDFAGAVVVSRKGEVVASAGGPKELLLKLAPFAVGLLELAERAGDEAGQGGFGALMLESDDGHIGLQAVGGNHLLFALAAAGAPVGLLRHDLAATARAFESELR